MRIPKIIHFVWAGGERQLPKKNLETVLDWAQKNPEFTVKVWVDPISCAGGIEKIKKKYRYTYDEMCVERVQQGKPKLQTGIDSVILADISQLNNEDKNADSKRAFAFARREIDGLSPNYGISSDLLRYAILYEEGGAYFDSDVYPGNTPLNSDELFEIDFTEDQPCLCVDPNSQNNDHIGNDAFICTPHNPQIYTILQLATNNCQGRNVPMMNIHGVEISSLYWKEYGGSQGIGMHYYRFNKDSKPLSRENREDLIYFTVRKTGPAVVQQIVCTAEDPRLLLEHPNIRAMDINLRHVNADHTNDSAWVNSIRAQGERSDIIHKAIFAIHFDIINLGELRLSDTIRQLCHSLDVDVSDNEDYCKLLNDFLANLHNNLTDTDLLSLSLIQADYFLPHLEEYCQQYSIPYDVKKSGFFPLFTHPDEPMPSMRLAILNWNNDDMGKKFYHDIQQHLNDTIFPLLSSEAFDKEKVERVKDYLSTIEDMTFFTPSSLPEQDKALLRATIAHVRAEIVNTQSQNHAAELFGKGKNYHQDTPPDLGKNNCCTIM